MFQACKVALNESTDFRSAAQLAVFARGCNSNSLITEGRCGLIQTHRTAAGQTAPHEQIIR
jgi:hypothetical protein